MAGGIYHIKYHISQMECISIGEKFIVIINVFKPLVLPVFAAFVRGINRYPFFGKFSKPCKVVGMDMRVSRSYDFKSLLFGQFIILIYITHRINNYGLLRLLAAN